MKQIPCFLKRLVPVCILILHSTLAFSDLPPGDLILSDVEIVQVVLEPRGLIAEKPASLKLTIDSTFTMQKYVTIRVNYNSGDTYLDTGGSPFGIPIVPGENVVYIPGGPAFPSSPEPWIDEGEKPYFVWDMEGALDDVQVMIDAEYRVTETDEGNNSKAFFVDVFHTSPLRVLIVPTALAFQEDWELDTNLIEKQRKFMEDTYPIPNVIFDYRGLWRINSIVTSGGSIDEDWYYNEVVLPITMEADLLDYDRVVIVHTEDLWRFSFCGSAIGMLRKPENRLPVVIVSQDHEELNYCFNRENLIAHEIGHTYFLWHPFSSLFPLPVYDSQQYSVTERTYGVWTKTFMDYDPCCLRYDSFCSTVDPLCGLTVPWWIDEERYQSYPKTKVDCSSEYSIESTYMWNLWDQFTETPPHMTVLAVRGTIFQNKFKLVNGYRFQGRPHIYPQEPPPSPPYYQILLLNDQEKPLANYPFKASFQYALEHDFIEEVKIIQTDAISFHINVPYVEGTTFIQMKDPNGNSLGSIAVSFNSPELTALYPNGGEMFPIGSEVVSCWQGQDQDGNDLTYLLAYSKNGGNDWIPIASDLKETCHAWTTKDLPPGDHYMVKVIATDGMNTGEVRSDTTFSLFIPIEAKVTIKPETINLRAKGKFTAFLFFPEPYSVKNIDLSTVVCEGASVVDGTTIKNILMVKFDREDLATSATSSAAVFNVTGKLKDGTTFIGSDTVNLIMK